MNDRKANMILGVLFVILGNLWATDVNAMSVTDTRSLTDDMISIALLIASWTAQAAGGLSVIINFFKG